MESLGLTQIIKDATRVTDKACTLIDHVVTTNPALISNSGALPLPSISDHCLIYFELSLTVPKRNKTIKTFRNLKNFDYLSFQHELELVQWDCILEMQTVDEKVKFVNENVLKHFDFYAPLKTGTFSKPKSPWLTDNIRLLINLRDKAYNKFKKTKKTILLEILQKST